MPPWLVRVWGRSFWVGECRGEGAWVGSICIQKPDPCPGLVAPLVTHLVPGIGSGSGASKVYTWRESGKQASGIP